MVAKVEDQSTQNPVTECQCREQTADILTRLETLEREALTERKLADLPSSNMIDAITKQMEFQALVASAIEVYEKRPREFPEDEPRLLQRLFELNLGEAQVEPQSSETARHIL